MLKKHSNSTQSDPFGLSAHMHGAKLDNGKPRMWLMMAGFAHALEAVADVTTQGAKKYTPNGWMQVENGQERYMDACARHLMAIGRGEVIDAETQCKHLAQVAWNALAVLELQERADQATA